MKLGDIVLYSGTSWFAGRIKKMDHSDISHVGVVTSLNPPQITEALNSDKTRSPEVSFAGASAVYVCSLKYLTDAQRMKIADYALNFSGDSYNYLDIACQLGDALSGTRWFTGSLGPHIGLMRHPICSFEGAESYWATIGYVFGGLKPVSVTPADMKNWIFSRPAEWDVEKVK